MDLKDFLNTYNPDNVHDLITVDVEPGQDSRFIQVNFGRHTVIINPIPCADFVDSKGYLDLDIHSFIDGKDATAGVFGMGKGKRVELAETGTTSVGYPSANLIVVLVGEQGGA